MEVQSEGMAALTYPCTPASGYKKSSAKAITGDDTTPTTTPAVALEVALSSVEGNEKEPISPPASSDLSMPRSLEVLYVAATAASRLGVPKVHSALPKSSSHVDLASVLS